MQTIIDLFNETCNKYPRKIACVYKDTTLTYAELHYKVDEMSNILYHFGIRHNDCVAIMLSKRPEFLITYLASIKLGAINVPINYKLTSNELNPILSAVEPKILISEKELLNKVYDLKSKIINYPQTLIVDDSEHEFLSFSKLAKTVPQHLCTHNLLPDDIVAIQYTSGTTSFPKGACWNHKGVLAHVKAMQEVYKITEKDNWLVLLPSFLSSHNSVVLPILTGSTSILMENNNPGKILLNIEKYKINLMMCAAVVALALHNLTQPEDYDISSLRLVIPGGMRFPKKDLIKFERKFKTSVMDVLAMTEMGIYLSNNFAHKRYGSVGKPVLNVKAKVVDKFDQEVSYGIVGEIITRAESMFCGYYKLHNETQKVIKDGWFHTGDLGRQDKDGFFWHVSRKSEMINVGGFKIYPQEVEEILMNNEKIEEVAISSAHDTIRGEIPKVFIVLKKDVLCSKQEIIKFCQKKIAHYKIPKIIKFCESLPKTGSGKICRKALCEV